MAFSNWHYINGKIPRELDSTEACWLSKLSQLSFLSLVVTVFNFAAMYSLNHVFKKDTFFFSRSSLFLLVSVRFFFFLSVSTDVVHIDLKTSSAYCLAQAQRQNVQAYMVRVRLTGNSLRQQTESQPVSCTTCFSDIFVCIQISCNV